MQEISYCSSKEKRGIRIIGYIRYRKGVNDLRHLRHTSFVDDIRGPIADYKTARYHHPTLSRAAQRLFHTDPVIAFHLEGSP
jgi:hypothetical protein